jgi:hypothetical protein
MPPAPRCARLRQRLRRSREQGWRRDSKGTTSHSEAPGTTKPPSSAARTGWRGTESGGRRAPGHTWWRRGGGGAALCDVTREEAGLFVRPGTRRRSGYSGEGQDAPWRSVKKLHLLVQLGKCWRARHTSGLNLFFFFSKIVINKLFLQYRSVVSDTMIKNSQQFGRSGALNPSTQVSKSGGS